MDNSEITVGQLVLVATPLGNLGDISRRALELLESADVIYAEDTRRSSTLFSAHSIPVNGRLRALHDHNEASLCDQVVAQVAGGRTVVVISDAGTPGISDPGARVVAAVAAAGLRVTTAPGPSAVIAALTISALPTERFAMEGFLPRKYGERELLYAQWMVEPRTIVFYESPQRLAATLGEMVSLFATRRICVAREMTKVHEEVLRGTVEEIADYVITREILGEIVVVLEGVHETEIVDDELIRAALRDQIDEGVSTRDAVAYVEESLGVAHRIVYQMALELRADDAL
ncbi:MAG TPA: 16S rRNA (cytidine(1402)-2'-O)-methyltransferase [Acidimicrobiales bacterium]|nr:16S rRNA (cytidine(1402)-2'-O)-methyltransferase [Acidimicrobiales bacterium]